MLVLARKSGESLIINDNIVLTIVDIKRDLVKIGIEAPKEVKIYRKELFDSIQEANKTAIVKKGIELPKFPKKEDSDES